ncbi:membrane protein insertase YidC [Flaviaesturariibacter flavus]|uniref:Membrane protein insertase YidC n=1 Tax=Flaviaesturariibacter flavus TaxID=2502780 RepID=A0A4R1BJV2_9BACT|nr:membrane protein insertase YidC [Flaviaesturariibacter flavus]TCJ17569.1 membrane protein insertase YidC [Flaviaesturariibacter flavus]
MNFDRNTIIGFVALAVLFLGYFLYMNKEQRAYAEQKAIEQRKQDSLAKLKGPDPATARLDSLRADSAQKAGAAGAQMATQIGGPEQTVTVENNVIRVVFTSKGGQPKYVELKNYKAPDSSLVRLSAAPGDRIDYHLNTGGTGQAAISSFNFTPGQAAPVAGGQRIAFTLNTPQGPVVHQYTLHEGDYMIDFDLQVPPAAVPNNALDIVWTNKAQQLQRDLSYERQQSAITFLEDGDYDNYNVFKEGPKTLDKAVNWVGVKQQFFSTNLIAKKNFASANLTWTPPSSEVKPGDKTVVTAETTLKLPLSNGAAPLAIYYGPNDYKLLKKYGYGLESQVNLGSGMFAFVKYLNRWVIIPVFDFFRTMTSNMGIVILLLTLFIRLLISPLTYSSYLSGAKMKALRPEIEKLKEKNQGDQQAQSMAQMQLFREAGVNPMGGCLPALFQIPIFFALYNFFNSAIALRGEHFLWSKDLSQYDAPIQFGFHIPMLGDHLSLFTIFAVVTSLLISLYSMSMTPTQDNPMMKYMPYIFPVIMLFIFNKLPSALTWYYTVSNVITLLLQFVIQNYIINHDKILVQIEENRKKPKKTGGWAEKMQQMQDQQKRMQELQNKNKKP